MYAPRVQTIPATPEPKLVYLRKVCILYRKVWNRCGVYQRVLRQRRGLPDLFQKSYVSVYSTAYHTEGLMCSLGVYRISSPDSRA